MYRLHDQTNQDNSFNFRSTIEKPTCKLGENSSFSFWGGGGGGETVIRDFLLDIYSAYKSFVRPVALGLEVSGSNDMF